MNIEVNDLSRLRQMILKHEWKEAYQLLSTLLAKNLPQSTVLVTGQMTRSCLRFRPLYSLDWVVRFAHEVTHFIQEGQAEGDAPDLPDEVDSSFSDAPYGVTNLVGGVEELWKSVSVAQRVDERAHHLVTALGEFITAEVCNYWEVVYPEEIELRERFWNAEHTPEGRIILPAEIDKGKLYRSIGFLKQPESLGYHSARLLSIVDEIELILNK